MPNIKVSQDIKDQFQKLQTSLTKIQLDSLGNQKGDITICPDKIGFKLNYSNGVVYLHPLLGIYAICGQTFKKWVTLKSEAGVLGYPITSYFSKGQCVFERGIIFDDKDRNYLYGPIFEKWTSLEAKLEPASEIHKTKLGYYLCNLKDKSQLIWKTELAGITFSSVHHVDSSYNTFIWKNINLKRYLDSNLVPISDTVQINFSGNIGNIEKSISITNLVNGILVTSKHGTFHLEGPILKEWNNVGGYKGVFGIPLSGIATNKQSGISFCQFENGIILSKGNITIPLQSLRVRINKISIFGAGKNLQVKLTQRFTYNKQGAVRVDGIDLTKKVDILGLPPFKIIEKKDLIAKPNDIDYIKWYNKLELGFHLYENNKLIKEDVVNISNLNIENLFGLLNGNEICKIINIKGKADDNHVVSVEYSVYRGLQIQGKTPNDVFKLNGPVLEEWLKSRNDAGFPICNTATKGNVDYTDFENGVILSDGINSSYIKNLEFCINTLTITGKDDFRDPIKELYLKDYYIKVDNLSKVGPKRIPAKGNFPYNTASAGDKKFELEDAKVSIKKVSHNTEIKFHANAYDADKYTDDDFQGEISGTVNMLTLFDLSFKHVGSSHKVLKNKSFELEYSVKKDLIYDAVDEHFRHNYWWPISNFGTEELTRKQFAATFSDVSGYEDWWTPANKGFLELFYGSIYKNFAAGGNCFGMCLESIYALKNRSEFSEPIYHNLENEKEADIRNVINIKQGYNLGVDFIYWLLEELFTGGTHNPNYVYNKSKTKFDEGDLPFLALYKYRLNKGHALLPYDYKEHSKSNKIIIADPNVPWSIDGNNNAPDPTYIQIDNQNNKYQYAYGEMSYAGDKWLGDRMLFVPYSVLSSHPRTPFYEFLIITAGILILICDDGECTQIEDDKGNKFYGNKGANSLESLKKLNLARIPFFTNENIGELYARKGFTTRNYLENDFTPPVASDLTFKIKGKKAGITKFASLKNFIKYQIHLQNETKDLIEIKTLDSDKDIKFEIKPLTKAGKVNLVFEKSNPNLKSKTEFIYEINNFQVNKAEIFNASFDSIKNKIKFNGFVTKGAVEFVKTVFVSGKSIKHSSIINIDSDFKYFEINPLSQTLMISYKTSKESINVKTINLQYKKI